jgi:hypothetical protein
LKDQPYKLRVLKGRNMQAKRIGSTFNKIIGEKSQILRKRHSFRYRGFLGHSTDKTRKEPLQHISKTLSVRTRKEY